LTGQGQERLCSLRTVFILEPGRGNYKIKIGDETAAKPRFVKDSPWLWPGSPNESSGRMNDHILEIIREWGGWKGEIQEKRIQKWRSHANSKYFINEFKCLLKE
jgi:hypothetical protein